MLPAPRSTTPRPSRRRRPRRSSCSGTSCPRSGPRHADDPAVHALRHLGRPLVLLGGGGPGHEQQAQEEQQRDQAAHGSTVRTTLSETWNSADPPFTSETFDSSGKEVIMQAPLYLIFPLASPFGKYSKVGDLLDQAAQQLLDQRRPAELARHGGVAHAGDVGLEVAAEGRGLVRLDRARQRDRQQVVADVHQVVRWRRESSASRNGRGRNPAPESPFSGRWTRRGISRLASGLLYSVARLLRARALGRAAADRQDERRRLRRPRPTSWRA